MPATSSITSEILVYSVKGHPTTWQALLTRPWLTAKHSEKHASFGTSEFPLYMLAHIVDVYYVDAYGTVKYLKARDYLSCGADKVFPSACTYRLFNPPAGARAKAWCLLIIHAAVSLSTIISTRTTTRDNLNLTPVPLESNRYATAASATRWRR